MKPRYHAMLWIWIIILLILTIITSIFLYRSGLRCSFLYTCPAFLLAGIASVTLLTSHKNQVRYIAKLSQECNHAELATLHQLPVGLCVIDENQTLLHYNTFFSEHVLEGEDLFGRKLTESIHLNVSLTTQKIHFQDKYYQVTAAPYQGDACTMTTLIWEDITELERMYQNAEDKKPCIVLVVVDNYEELIQNAKESARLETSVAIEKLLENFISETNGILKRLKASKFIAVLEEKYIQQLMKKKFKLLDEARNIHIDEKNYVTFSIGIGHGADSLQENEILAEQCLDMALGRGGDQAVIKTDNDFQFFGGVSKGVEKKSRAKSRIVANALQDLIFDSENVYLMGHHFGDLDSIGSACGLAGVIRLMQVSVNVVVDPEKNLSQQLIAMVKEELSPDLFLTPQEALDTITDDTLLIIVDTHNKDILESMELYQAAKKVVVIDHHRKTIHYVDDAMIFHHEPYASSACEMVTELIQYFKLEKQPPSCCADCLLSGIMLDTKNFVMRTGVRTFEAAAYLRKIGADTVRVKTLFSGSIACYKNRAEIVSSAEIIDCYAIATAPAHMPEVRLVAPQAADELLNISHVDAAFVIYSTGTGVSVSARSWGNVNVQVIMEKLGGGGHQTMAAAQLEYVNVEETREKLMQALSDIQETQTKITNT